MPLIEAACHAERFQLKVSMQKFAKFLRLQVARKNICEDNYSQTRHLKNQLADRPNKVPQTECQAVHFSLMTFKQQQIISWSINVFIGPPPVQPWDDRYPKQEPVAACERQTLGP